MLSSFRTSLQLCARLGSSQTRLLGVCQLGALQCAGRKFTLAIDSECNWPEETFESCKDCKPGTNCQGESAGPLLKDNCYLIQYGFYFGSFQRTVSLGVSPRVCPLFLPDCKCFLLSF